MAIKTGRVDVRQVLSVVILLACAFPFVGCLSSATGGGSDYGAVQLPTPPGFCACPSCDCACKGEGAGPCHCSLSACDCPCNRCICTPDGRCTIIPRFEKAEPIEGEAVDVESDPLPPPPPPPSSGAAAPGVIEAGRPLTDAERARIEAEALIGKPSGLECPSPELAGDIEKNVRLWYRNKTSPGSCVQCSIGLCGCAQNVPNASLLLWPTDFGPAELHGSYPSRLAEYARKRGLRIYNVTGSQTYAWMAWACRNGRPCAIGCKTAHFQTLMGHDPDRGLWYVCDSNSPERIDVYTDAEFRSMHRASGEWCVILE